jgi:hypothetical protein
MQCFGCSFANMKNPLKHVGVSHEILHSVAEDYTAQFFTHVLSVWFLQVAVPQDTNDCIHHCHKIG